MKKLTILAAAAMAFAAFAGEREISETGGDFVRIVAGEDVYAGKLAIVGTNGLAYAVNTAKVVGGTVIGLFQHSAAAGEEVLAKRGGFVLENAASGTLAKKDIVMQRLH